MQNRPIKRHTALKPVSREHHHGLLLCWKIRQGISKGVDVARIKKYADWFYQEHTLPHFEIEEKHIFPVLGNDHELVKKALAEHRRLKRLFEDEDEVTNSISLLEEELEAHIRFEERVLFNEIQEMADAETLAAINEVHEEKAFVENTEDQFWV